MTGFSSVYGFVGIGLAEARVIVERALQVKLSACDSLYRGGEYLSLKESDAELILQANFDCLDEDLAEPDFPDIKTLLYLDGKESAEGLANRLRSIVSEIVLLRHMNY